MLETRGPDGSEFFAVAAHPRLRLLVLDAYQVSTFWPADHAHGREAREILQANNPNDTTREGVDWHVGLQGSQRRFVPYNGAFGAVQREWLHGQLQQARAGGERVVLLSHVPVVNRDPCNISWDAEEVLALLDGAGPGVVAAVLAGHDHQGSYICRNNVHHITLRSPLNLGSSGQCFGHMDIYEDRLVLSGPALADLVDPALLAEQPDPLAAILPFPAWPSEHK